MGNGGTKLTGCFSSFGAVGHCRRRGSAAVTSEPYEEELGHSFCYVRPDPLFPRSTSTNKVHHSDENTIFRSVSGAAVSANAATPLSTALDTSSSSAAAAAAFESSTCFSSAPLHPLSDRCSISVPIDRGGSTSSPIDPLDRRTAAAGVLPRSLSHGLALRRRAAASLLRSFTNSISRTISVPVTETHSLEIAGGGENLHWAQGRAGEDRIHVVISEEQGWIFVGIYDGFNGPDATEYLLSNLYAAVQQELKELLWDEEKQEVPAATSPTSTAGNDSAQVLTRNWTSTEANNGERKLGMTHKKRKPWPPTGNWKGRQRRWKYEWEREIFDSDQTLKKKSNRLRFIGAENHCKVLKSLSLALKKTEEAFLDNADMIVSENPELALMGSCVLVMVMKGEDVYLMNVGDSRAVLAQKSEQNSLGKERRDLERINEEIENELESNGGGDGDLVALQLTKDHSTCVEEEVWRIRAEHPEDASAVMNDRVKGSLKVTRAFGAGFLKQPKWNNALLEMFRIDYIGTSPYITCCPFLYHHKLGPGDRFLILSSDGLYQYFTNEEAVAEIDLFVAANPKGDPAQHLVEEVLFRAAKNAGMDFHELLEIPQGDRRRYHDDVSIIVISLEGRIWRSCI